jgi:hypothetical protein
MLLMIVVHLDDTIIIPGEADHDFLPSFYLNGDSNNVN